MYVAVDDTDSRDGMCTTFLLTEIIRRSGLDVIGYPSLVRLNPAIKHKTRGNGALVVNLGKGKGERHQLGMLDGIGLECYEDSDGDADADSLMKIATDTVEEFAVIGEPDTNPGIVISRHKFDEHYYWKAVREEIDIDDAESFILSQGGLFRKFKNGRGIIGAAAAIAWPAKAQTFEVIAYRSDSTPALSHRDKMEIAEMADEIPLTFNNIDRKNRYPAIFPKERTPVLMGIRGFSHSPIIESVPMLLSHHALDASRYICFQTNQGTDDHIIRDEKNLVDRQSYSLEGVVVEEPVPIKGSHYFSRMRLDGFSVGISAYEPTKEFRSVFRNLRPGDRIRVYGTYISGGLNIEKMEIISLSRHYVRRPPECDNCGEKMENRGEHDYRCQRCGSRKALPSYIHLERDISPGRYDVPVIARRHLSRAFEFEDRKYAVREANVV